MTKPNQTKAALTAAAAIAKAAAKPSSTPAGISKRGGSDYYIDPTSLVIVPEWNDRFDWGDIDELARQIKTQKAQDGHGLLNKIRVQRTDDPLKFNVVDGERRSMAISKLLKDGEIWEFGIPAHIEPKDADKIDLMVKKIVANDGKRFLPLEEAQAFKKLRDAGLTIQQICDRVGRAQVHVVASLAMLDGDASLQEAVKAGKITTTIAKNIAVHARGDKAKQAELVAEAAAAGNDKVAKRKVAAKIEQSRQDKAAKKGRVLKVRLLTNEQLDELGAKVAKLLEAKAKEAGMQKHLAGGLDALVAHVKTDEKLVAAYTLGAIQGLKAAAGLKGIELDI